MRCDAWAGSLSWWRCQSPFAHSCGLLSHPKSFYGGMFKLNVKFVADSLLHSSVIFNVTAPQYTCSLNGIPLTGTVKSSLFTHAHSSPLSLAARLHQCCTNSSRHTNSGWTFPGQTLYINIWGLHCSFSFLFFLFKGCTVFHCVDTFPLCL